MRFSIITICYNPGDNIKTAIESVLSQDYSNIEHIIIDGASTNGTVELIKSYGDKINRFISEPDEGIYDAMNKGIKYSTGEVIGFLNAGDFFAGEDVISQVSKALEKSDCCFGVSGFGAGQRDN